MSRSVSGKPDPDLEGVELLFHQKGGSASFGTKIALSLNGVDRSCMNLITGGAWRAKCSNILHDSSTVVEHSPVHPKVDGSTPAAVGTGGQNGPQET